MSVAKQTLALSDWIENPTGSLASCGIGNPSINRLPTCTGLPLVMQVHSTACALLASDLQVPPVQISGDLKRFAKAVAEET